MRIRDELLFANSRDMHEYMADSVGHSNPAAPARDIICGLRPELKPRLALEAESDPASNEADMHAGLLAHRLAT